MRLVGCIRVSRVAGREGDSFISPQQQRDRIERHAQAQGHLIVAWQEDLDQPGSRMDRPGLEAALQMVEQGGADGIAVAKLDRFARSVAGAAKVLERLEHANGVLVAVDLGMDTSTPAGKLMRNVLMALAEFELDRIRENWRDATTRAVKRGVQVAPRIVLGYRRLKDGTLEPDPQTSEVAREAFLQRGAGASWSTIQKLLDERAPKPGDGRWTQGTLIGMLASRTYRGEVSQGPVVNTDAHQALVSEDEWQAAQATYARPVTRNSPLLLAGIIRCAGCGFTMTSAGSGARGYVNYRCTAKHAKGDCPEPARISVLRADGYVTSRFLNWASDTAAHSYDLTVEVERAIAAAEAADAELAAYRDTALVSIVGERSYLEGLEARARTVTAAQQTLGELRRRNVGPINGIRLQDEWEKLGTDERRLLLAAGIDAVFVRRAHLRGRAAFEHRLHICWAGDAPADLPGRRVTALRPFTFPNDLPAAVRIAETQDR